jgi:enoyl-[acyl-carrier-protein] reductase (NADH)
LKPYSLPEVPSRQGGGTIVNVAAEEVATLVALLASPRTANVTGSNYIIDGGLIKTM